MIPFFSEFHGIIRNHFEWFVTHAKKPHAWFWLGVYTFLEALILPFPSEPFLALMILAQRRKALLLALFATTVSVLGAFAGYLIGYALSESVLSSILSYPRLAHDLARATHAVNSFAFLAVFFSAILPIPFTPVILAAGILNMHPVTFLVASIVGRGLRYFGVSLAVLYFGERALMKLKEHVMRAGTAFIILIIFLALALLFVHR